jgi:hypothetical protein
MKELVLSESADKFIKRLSKLSEKKQMNLTDSHPWDEPYDENAWLKKRENLSIYGTKFYDLATEEERIRLAKLETGGWWASFIALENLVTEYYMKLINHQSLAQFPSVVEYMMHFCKEEIVHSMVFRKAMEHYKIEPLEVSEFIKDFYQDNASMEEFPLKAIYLTIIIEWFAENNAMLDLQNDFVAPLAAAVAFEHNKEETRHIAWGKRMVTELCHQVPGFMDEAREFTPGFLRGLVDTIFGNMDVLARANFSHPAFQDIEDYFETVLFSDNKKRIDKEIMTPIFEFFVEIGIYHPDYRSYWEESRFEEIIDSILEQQAIETV